MIPRTTTEDLYLHGPIYKALNIIYVSRYIFVHLIATVYPTKPKKWNMKTHLNTPTTSSEYFMQCSGVRSAIVHTNPANTLK